MIETLEIINKKFKSISLINNAGTTSDGLMIRMKIDQWNNVIKTNLDPPPNY